MSQFENEFHDMVQEAICDWYRDELKRADARILELETAVAGLSQMVDMMVFGADHER